jgi:hypothetical protein
MTQNGSQIPIELFFSHSPTDDSSERFCWDYFRSSCEIVNKTRKSKVLKIKLETFTYQIACSSLHHCKLSWNSLRSTRDIISLSLSLSLLLLCYRAVNKQLKKNAHTWEFAYRHSFELTFRLSIDGNEVNYQSWRKHKFLISNDMTESQ